MGGVPQHACINSPRTHCELLFCSTLFWIKSSATGPQYDAPPSFWPVHLGEGFLYKKTNQPPTTELNHCFNMVATASLKRLLIDQSLPRGHFSRSSLSASCRRTPSWVEDGLGGLTKQPFHIHLPQWYSRWIKSIYIPMLESRNSLINIIKIH